MYMGMESATLVDGEKLKKVALAKRVGRFFVGDNDSREVAAVTDLAKLLARDAEDAVRMALAFEIRECNQIPKDLALRIASDIEDVSSPFLKSSPALNDQDLADLIPELAEHARAAIARREHLGKHAIDQLITYAKAPVISVLASNDRAAMNDQQFHRIVDNHSGSPIVLESLSRRADLPMIIVERLIDRVSVIARSVLEDRYDLTPTLAKSASGRAKLSALFDKLRSATPDQVRAYVTDLRSQKRLEDDLIIQAAKADLMIFVETALAIEAGITIGEARNIIDWGAPKEILSLLRDAGIARENMGQLMRELEKDDI